MDFSIGTIGLKVVSYTSIAKCISVIRKYNPISMAEIKNAIETNNYILTCSYISHPGVRMIRKCYDELTKSGVVVEIYEHDRLTDRELISNLISSHRQTNKEVWKAVNREVEEDSGNE